MDPVVATFPRTLYTTDVMDALKVHTGLLAKISSNILRMTVTLAYKLFDCKTMTVKR